MMSVARSIMAVHPLARHETRHVLVAPAAETTSPVVQYGSPVVQYGDDSGPGFQASGGNWTVEDGAGYRGSETVTPAGNGSGVATWTFAVTPGTYQVSATWPATANAATNATYSVLDATTVRSSTVVNQRLSHAEFSDGSAGARWENLGGPVAITGTTLVVQLSDNANGSVIADGVRIQRVS